MCNNTNIQKEKKNQRNIGENLADQFGFKKNRNNRTLTDTVGKNILSKRTIA